MLQGKLLLLWSLLFAILFLWFGHNQILSEDMVIHLPFIKKLQNPVLYSKDYFFHYPNPQSQATLYYPIMAAIIGGRNPIPVFEVIYFIIVFFFCLAILSFIPKINANRYTGIIFLMLLAFRFSIGGTAIQLIETSPLPRIFGLTFGLWSIFFLWDHRYLFSTFLLFIGALFHPLTIFYFILCFTGYYLLATQYKVKIISLFCLSFAIIIAFRFVSLMSFDWLQIIKIRNSYAFMELWNLKSWFSLSFLLFPGIVCSYRSHTNQILKKLFAVTLITSIFITLIHLGFTSIYPLRFVIALQLGRIWLFPVWLSLLMFSATLAKYLQYRGRGILITGALISLLAFRINYINQQGLINPSWMALQKWARTETDQKCLFLVPFYSKGFRLFSERSIVGEYKDGALSFYNRDFARDWWQRTQNFSKWETMSTTDILQFQMQYEFDYMVEKTPANRSLPVAYVNSDYVAYDVRKEGKCL